MQPDYSQPVADYPRYHGENSPTRTAYLDGAVSCSYKELDERSNRVANALISLGCQPGDRVVYLGVNSGPYVEVFFGACKAKTVYTGINWRLTPVELDYIFNDAAAKVIFCDPQFLKMLEGMRASIPSLEQVISVELAGFTHWRDQHSATDPALEHLADDAIVQFYTSGTTGKPKGVVITNQAMEASRRSEDNYGGWFLQSSRDEVSINAMPNFHIAGLEWLLIGLFRGAKVVLMAAPDPAAFLDLIEAEKATHLFAVPVVLAMMLEEQKKTPRNLSSLKVFHYGASPAAPAMLREAIKLMGCGFCQYYGMTEVNGIIVVLSPEDHDLANPERLKSCGKAVPGMRIKICDHDGNEQAPKMPGEIWVETGSLMKEYWNNPEATAEVCVDGWYKSGDGGYLDEDGFLYMSDRIKDMIISGGENIYPTEVENAFYEHPTIAEVAVVGVADEKWGEAVKAVVVLKPGLHAAEEELIVFLRERLAGYKIPRIYNFVSELPRTASGKIQKYKLR